MSESQVVTVGEYLAQRLVAVGVKHIFGIPGDYVLGLMDVFLANSLQLIGTCNELNAGYAADAYARLNGVGAVCVTYDVGGLSLLNAVVGAYAELVPLIVISGAPHTSQHRNQLLMHHTTGDYKLQHAIFSNVTVAAVMITNPSQAATQIDVAIAACLRYKRPVYIEIPADLVHQPCTPSTSVEIPEIPMSDRHSLTEAVEEAVSLLSAAERPVIFAGIEFHRFGIEHKLSKLLEQTGYPIATTILGKSIISEMHPQFIGNYAGSLSREYVRQRVEDADCILCLGALMSDMNLGGFTAHLDEIKLINANSDKVKIKHHYYSPICLGDFVDGLAAKLQHRPYETLGIKPAASMLSRNFVPQPEQKISNVRFYERMNHFLEDNSIAIADTGDALVATIDLVMHGDNDFIAQAFYTSIGYAVPACLGAAIANRDRRVIAFIGDGAFQMTGQEISTIIRKGLNPIIFLINNDGYTVERVIHEGPYNDIQPWKYHLLPQVFGDSWSCEVRTEGELEAALTLAKANTDRLSFIEVHFDRLDCCQGLVRLGKALSAMDGL
ncbi:MAG: alpha-keto acid decarboxylase family protein [Pseudanabaena sp. RU_4_16]|nr:alpha-keto acid decarboxylase family protein [Pseudanabaena sp. RU_4_16]